MFPNHSDAIEKARASQARAAKAAADKRRKADDAEFEKAKKPPAAKAAKGKAVKTAKVDTKRGPTGKLAAQLPSGKAVAVASGDLRQPTPAWNGEAPKVSDRPAWMDTHVCDPAILKAAHGAEARIASTEDYLKATIGKVPKHSLGALEDLVRALDPKAVPSKKGREAFDALVAPIGGTDDFIGTVLDSYENDIRISLGKDKRGIERWRDVSWHTLVRTIAPNAKRRDLLLRFLIQFGACMIRSIEVDLENSIDEADPFEFHMETLVDCVFEANPPDIWQLDTHEMAAQFNDLSPAEQAIFLRRIGATKENP